MPLFVELSRRPVLPQGAFYGYYPDKAALFDALVSEAADTLMEQFKAAQRAHYDLITEEKQRRARNCRPII